MKKFYISAKDGLSGISKYSNDFYRLVLKERGYIFIDSKEALPNILSEISSRDHVHIEIGIFQKKEIEILFCMLNASYPNVAVTLHDAPLIKYPFHDFEHPLLNKVSKFYDKYAGGFKSMEPLVRKIKTIYVLSRKGADAVRETYGVENVFHLPHIVDMAEIEQAENPGNDFIYFGFIGRNKGIQYSLELHRKLLDRYPDVNFYVVGSALGKEKKFYTYLQDRYRDNVHYLGYVPEENLTDIFRKATFALQLFKDYKFYWPFSGSILYSLKKGKILLTNKVNTVPEIIENGKNGFYLSGDLRKDTETMGRIMDNRQGLEGMRQSVYEYLQAHHSPERVGKQLID